MAFYELTDRFLIPNDIAIIWRYMDDWKFDNLIETESLYCPNAITWGNYDEGYLSISDLEWLQDESKRIDPINWQPIFESKKMAYDKWKRYTYINCWAELHYESRRMWHNFVKSHNGVALRIKASELKNAMIETTFPHNIYISKIHYYDPISERIGLLNLTRFYARKFQQFQEENEVRTICMLDINEEPPDHITIDINLQHLIKEIVFSPYSTEEYIEKVKNQCQEKGLTPRFSLSSCRVI